MYLEEYNRSIEQRESFWEEQAKALHWTKFPSIILNQETKKWFEDGETNLSYLCLDQHIADGFGEQAAIIYDSPVTGVKRSISYTELHKEVSLLAGGLKKLGISKGDTVIIYMPMIPEAIASMLACVRIGAIHSVVFGGFAPHELAIRIDDCKPKLIICASNGIEVNNLIPYKPLVDEAIHLANYKPDHVLLFDRKQGVTFPTNKRDLDYTDLIQNSEPAEAIPLPASHPSYILYTSGTTGKPKGIVRDTGGYATALKYTMKAVYDVSPGEHFWAASDVGWVVGHSYIVYGPLINRNTSILYEGKPVRTPDASAFWRVIKEHNVKVMFTAPTAIRAIRKEDPNGNLIKELSPLPLKYLFLAGERCDIATLQWAGEKLGVPVLDHWWQTESGWPMVANMAGIGLNEVKPGSATFPVCGYDLKVVDERGNELEANEEGYIVIKQPLPPGNLLGIWENEERFLNGYLKRFKGFYFSGDGGYKDEDGYVFITGRVDDIINVAGHRLSTAEMEEIVSSNKNVVECAVIGIHCELKGQKPLGLIVLKQDNMIDVEAVKAELIQAVRHEIGPVASFKDVVVVQRLPKTRSGKILRKLLRTLADEGEVAVPSTIDDPVIIDEIKAKYLEESILK